MSTKAVVYLREAFVDKKFTKVLECVSPSNINDYVKATIDRNELYGIHITVKKTLFGKYVVDYQILNEDCIIRREIITKTILIKGRYENE